MNTNNYGRLFRTKATLLLWLGWLLMIVGFFIPIIHISVPNPYMAELLFWGQYSPSVIDEGVSEMASHVPIEGVKVVAFIIITLLKKMSLSIAWLFLLLLSSPVLLAITAPVQISAKSPYTNMVLAILYCIGLILPLVILLNSAMDNVIGTGYYFWTAALMMLCTSRILVCRSSWKN